MLSRFTRALVVASAFAVGISSASAQDITLRLSPAQVAEVGRLIDLQPISKAPPAAFWELQALIDEALKANPDALRAVLQARSAAR